VPPIGLSRIVVRTGRGPGDLRSVRPDGIQPVADSAITPDERGYHVDVGTRYTCVAWPGRRTTYVLCAPLPQEALLGLADAVRAQHDARIPDRS